MKAQSDVYIKLQNIYKAKARQDVEEVLRMVQASPGGRDVDPAEVELFCKNAAFVKLIKASGGGAGSNGSFDESAERLATVTGKCLWRIISRLFFARHHDHHIISTPPPLSFHSTPAHVRDERPDWKRLY